MSQYVEEHVLIMEKVLGPETVAHVGHLTNDAPKNQRDFVGLVICLVIGPLTTKTMG